MLHANAAMMLFNAEKPHKTSILAALYFKIYDIGAERAIERASKQEGKGERDIDIDRIS